MEQVEPTAAYEAGYVFGQVIIYGLIGLGVWLLYRRFAKGRSRKASRIPTTAPLRQSRISPTSFRPKHSLAEFRSALASGNWVAADIETTGLRDDDAIIEVAVVDAAGQSLVDRKIAGPPKWADASKLIRDIIGDRVVVFYNAEFDLRMSHHYSARVGCENPFPAGMCAMLAYAEHRGQVNRKTGEYRWARLVDASYDLDVGLAPDHTAGVDAEVCRRVTAAIVLA